MMDGAFEVTKLRRVFPLMRRAVIAMLRRLDDQVPQQGAQLHVDVSMTHVTADIIFRTILTTALTDDDAKDIFEAFNTYQLFANRVMMLECYGLPRFISWWRCQRAASRIRAKLKPIIHRRHKAYVEAGE